MDLRIVVENLPFLFMVVIIFIILFIFLKFKKNRILVEILSCVDGGLISSSNRYHIVLDRKTKTKHLKPMFGKESLFCPQDKFFKKVEGNPFIGINRHLTYIKDGKDVKAVLPSSDLGADADIYKVEYTRWVFLNDREEFLRSIDKNKILFLLSIYAPLVVIIATILFFSITIMYQIGVLHTLEVNIEKMTETIINTIK